MRNFSYCMICFTTLKSQKLDFGNHVQYQIINAQTLCDYFRFVPIVWAHDRQSLACIASVGFLQQSMSH